MASANIFLISDTHFGHRNIYNFVESDGLPVRRNEDNTPRLMDETDELMVQNWNNVVRGHDIIYHLGDVYFGQGYTQLYRLNGRKRLILGNHDDGKDARLQQIFQKIMVWRMFPEWKLILSHIPLHESVLTGKVNYNFHGHIHNKPNVSPIHINCSVERSNYTPKINRRIKETFMTTLFLIYVSVLLLLALFVYATHDKIFYLNLFLIQRPFQIIFYRAFLASEFDYFFDYVYFCFYKSSFTIKFI